MKLLIILVLFGISLLQGSLNDDKKLNELIANLNAEHVKQENIDDLVKYVESSYNTDTQQISAYKLAIDKIGKYYLPAFGPKIKFYLSGPDQLEIFILLQLKDKGMDNHTLKNILLAAFGQYAKLGDQSRKLLQSKGFSQENIDIIDNYEFLCSGGKIKLKEIVLMANSKIATKEIADIIINSDMSPIKFTKENAHFLESLGVPKEIVLLLVYRDIFISGPMDYRVYDVLVDERFQKLPHNKIENKIASSGWYYRDFSELDSEILTRAGISKNLINAMRKQTVLFTSHSSELTKKYEQKNHQNEEERKHTNFVKREEIVKKVIASNVVFSGLVNNTKEIAKGDETLPREKSIVQRVGSCIAKVGANQLCDQVPFPFNYGCSALANNIIECK